MSGPVFAVLAGALLMGIAAVLFIIEIQWPGKLRELWTNLITKGKS